MGTERSTEYAPGKVSSQDPSAGAPIPLDRFVKYRLAAPFAPEPGVPEPPKKTVRFSEPLIPVPNVVGFGLKRGFAEISKAGLVPPLAQSVGKERSNRRSGEITRQDPPAKTLVKRDTPVKVWVSIDSPPPPPWLWVAIILGALVATAVVYLLAKQIWDLIHPPIVELCPVLDPGDQKLEKVGRLVAAGGG